MINDNKDEKSRLVDCFSAVFPALNREQIARADQFTLSEWDSMATVTLISVIEDEFHVEIPATEMEKLVSFEGFLKVLTDATVNSASKEICKTVSVGTQPRRLGDSRSTHERS